MTARTKLAASGKPVIHEGDWFLVPLLSGGSAVGRATRIGRGGLVFGYFFGPKVAGWPSDNDLAAFSPRGGHLAGALQRPWHRRRNLANEAVGQLGAEHLATPELRPADWKIGQPKQEMKGITAFIRSLR
ncbi:MAG: hypothetical protein JNK82_44020 [Myxococcaceae bacterium]|nr:hypothetical protein [Myxococcaceae bacterium]